MERNVNIPTKWSLSLPLSRLNFRLNFRLSWNRLMISRSSKFLHHQNQPPPPLPLSLFPRGCRPSPLCEPSLCDSTELLLDAPKEYGGVIGNDHDGLLHRAPGHIRRAIDELPAVELARARDAEERGRLLAAGVFERKVRKVLGGAVRAVRERQEREQRPLRDVRGVLDTDPLFDLGTPTVRREKSVLDSDARIREPRRAGGIACLAWLKFMMLTTG